MPPKVASPAAGQGKSQGNGQPQVLAKAGAGSKATTVSPGTPGSVTPPRKPSAGPASSAGNSKSRDFTPGSTPIKFSNQMKQVAKRAPKPPPKGFSLRRLAVQLTALYALIAYFFICPNDRDRAPNVCASYRQLEHYRHRAVNAVAPYLQPHFDKARSTVEPYVEPYVQAAQPLYYNTHKFVAPHFSKAQTAFDKQVRPRLLDAVTHGHKTVRPHLRHAEKQYAKRVQPHVNRYTRLATELYDINVKPYVDEVHFEYERKIKPFYVRHFRRVLPVFHQASAATSHHLRNTAYPFASQTFETSRKTYGKHVHPRLVSGVRFLIDFLRENLWPQVGRFQSKYISPHLSKIQDKAWAYKADKIAKESVKEMDADLGKQDINDEIQELLSATEPMGAATTTSYLQTATGSSIEAIPTAIDTETEVKDDALTQKIKAEDDKVRLNAEKRSALEALHDLYEIEIPKLGETEYTLLADRLTVLRKSALRDIPARFDPALQNFKAECDKWVSRLEKYWDKAERDERTIPEDKIRDGDRVANKASVKIAEAAEELEDEIDAYMRAHVVREIASTEKAYKAIQAFVSKAQEELGSGYAWLDDVTHDDWKRFHTLAALDGTWHHNLFSLRNGSMSHSSLDRSLNIELALERIKLEILMATRKAENKIRDARTYGEAKAQGQYANVMDAMASARSAAVEAFAQATHAAGSVIGITPTPTDVQGTASSILAAATGTIASVYDDAASSASSLASVAGDNVNDAYTAATDGAVSFATAVSSSAESLASVASSGVSAAAANAASFIMPSNVQRALDDAQSSVAHAYSEASQTLLRAAGVQPSPTDAAQTASSILSRASAYLSEAQAGAGEVFGSYASEASKTAMSLAGQPTATGPQASVESAYSVASASASAYAEAVASSISSAAANAQSVAAKIAGDAYDALPRGPSTDDLPALSDVSATVSSQIHQATREALKKVGVSVTPESVEDHAQSAYRAFKSGRAAVVAASISANVAASAGSAYSEASSNLHSATRSAAKAAGFTPTPESPSEYAESAYSRVNNAADSLFSAAREAAPTIPAASEFQANAASAYSVASSAASEALSSASCGVHSATRSAASALGAEVTPEGVREHVESVASSVSSLASKATEAVKQHVEL